jgi:hypothetical protein
MVHLRNYASAARTSTKVVLVREVTFKRQVLGVWRVTDQDGTRQMNEEQAGKRMSELIREGFTMHTHGKTMIRSIVFRKG